MSVGGGTLTATQFLTERTNHMATSKGKNGWEISTVSMEGEQMLSDISGGAFLEWEVMFPAMRTHTGCWVSSHLSRKEPCRQGELLPGAR